MDSAATRTARRLSLKLPCFQMTLHHTCMRSRIPLQCPARLLLLLDPFPGMDSSVPRHRPLLLGHPPPPPLPLPSVCTALKCTSTWTSLRARDQWMWLHLPTCTRLLLLLLLPTPRQTRSPDARRGLCCNARATAATAAPTKARTLAIVRLAVQ